MSVSTRPAQPLGLAALWAWPRLRFTLGVSLGIGLLFGFGWKSGLPSLLVRTVTLGLLAMLAFGLFERWPQRLPPWCARWVLQVLAVGALMPLATWVIYVWSTAPGAPPFWRDKDRLGGFMTLSVLGVLLAPWSALAALVRQKDAWARNQALAFDLERSEFERRELDARLRLLQAQVEPHFLFNTLANVRELVDTGSPQASPVLGSLIAYLRAAVPRLHESCTTLKQELELARAYLEVMHMRMPDRLQFSLQADEGVLTENCPPMTVLTLVENAVRHGIDPSEEGGRIDILVEVREAFCRIEVVDTGVGLQPAGRRDGTGLANLQERLRLACGDGAQVQLLPNVPRGVRAEVRFPARRPTP